MRCVGSEGGKGRCLRKDEGRSSDGKITVEREREREREREYLFEVEECNGKTLQVKLMKCWAL